MIIGRDIEKSNISGWDNMLSRGGNGWLGRAFFRRLTEREMHNLAKYPNACCVGINAGRLSREVRRRRAKGCG